MWRQAHPLQLRDNLVAEIVEQCVNSLLFRPLQVAAAHADAGPIQSHEVPP